MMAARPDSLFACDTNNRKWKCEKERDHYKNARHSSLDNVGERACVDLSTALPFNNRKVLAGNQRAAPMIRHGNLFSPARILTRPS